MDAFISAGEWRLLEPPKQLYRFAETDDRPGDSAAPTIDRPQPDRSLNRCLSGAKLKFRIHSPPARSLQTISSVPGFQF
jgi:hypothetical protein